MSVISKMRRQDAVYWGPPVPDGNGSFTWPSPVAIKCRWDAVEGEVVGPRTQDVQYQSTIYVDQEVEIDGYLFLGTLSDVGTDDPTEIAGARRIVGYSESPNFRATEWLRWAVV